MVVSVLEAFSFESVGLESVVVEGADGVEVGLLGKLLELFLALVEVEELLETVVMVPDVVLVLEDALGSVDLPLVLH